MKLTPEARKEIRSIYRAELKRSNDDLMERIKGLLVGMVEEETEQYLTTDQACEFLGISPRTLTRYRNQNGLPSVGDRKKRRYPKSLLITWQKSFLEI